MSPRESAEDIEDPLEGLVGGVVNLESGLTVGVGSCGQSSCVGYLVERGLVCAGR